jgi:hypothetical protein
LEIRHGGGRPLRDRVLPHQHQVPHPLPHPHHRSPRLSNPPTIQFLRTIDAPQEIALQSAREAYLLSYFEIFDTAYTISGSYTRLNGFFRDNGELIKEGLQDSSKREAKRSYQTMIITYFVKQGGMESIVQIIDQLLLREELIPFLFLQSLTSLFNGLCSLISTADREAVIEKIIKSTPSVTQSARTTLES